MPSKNSNDAILAYLAKIDESTQALTQRVNQIERNQSMDTTPVRQGSHSHDNDAAESFCPQVASTSRPNRQSLRFQDSNLPTMQSGHSSQGANSQNTETLQNPNIQGNPPSSHTWQPQGVNHDNIILSIDALRGNPTVSDAVAKVLASYDTQARTHVLQGKQPTLSTSHHSGRYNVTDTCNVSPQYRWPNEGYQGSAQKKHIPYDDLILPQWAVGQLSNIHQIEDLSLVKQSLLQVILALRDATSLPWQAVRNAWAHSMHDVEEGRLTWADNTQWSLNRLSNSQIAMSMCKLYHRRKYVNITMRANVLMKGTTGSLSMSVHSVVDKVGTVFT